jgi:hypothetical protein
MKRPHIPLSVKVAVAERMLRDNAQKGMWNDVLFEQLYDSRKLEISPQNPWPLKDRIDALLHHLFGDDPRHLDHDPALALRMRLPDGRYSPEANDPEFLVYRRERDHLQKTVGRKADAEKTVTTIGSDVWLQKKFRRLERPKRRKAKIPSRPFPKRRKK